jgi:hypothetical protein
MYVPKTDPLKYEETEYKNIQSGQIKQGKKGNIRGRFYRSLKGLDSSGSVSGLVAGCCEHCNELYGSIKGRKFLDQLSDCQLLKKGRAALSY